MLLDLQQRAEHDLRFIRSAIARAEGMSSVSGLGGIWMGAVALIAAALAASRPLPEQLLIWIVAAAIAAPLGALACWRKGRRGGVFIHWDPVRRFLLCLVPAIVVAVLLTARLWASAPTLIPSVWLMLYGCGVLAAGTYAVGAVVALGAGFILLGACSLLLDAAWSNGLLAAGFGGLHIGFGFWVYKRHGG
ncbi:MAG TPA: hypothetical protein VF210_16780 [Pseudomonadales bacterium]